MPSWLSSCPAYRFFLWSSWVIVALGIAFLVMDFALYLLHLQSIDYALPDAAQELVVPCAAILVGSLMIVFCGNFFGMVLCCMLQKDLPLTSKIVWLVVFFVTGPFGTSLYFFAKYKPHIALKAVSATS